MPSSDRTGVIAPPLLIHPAFLALGWLLARWHPLPLTDAVWLRWLAILCLAVSGWLAVWAILIFRREGTTINPLGGTARIVASGPFGFTRNPMYVALALAHLGIGLLLTEAWYLLLLVPTMLVMHFGVVRREERYLEARFGDAYRNYRARVRRWI